MLNRSHGQIKLVKEDLSRKQYIVDHVYTSKFNWQEICQRKLARVNYRLKCDMFTLQASGWRSAGSRAGSGYIFIKMVNPRIVLGGYLFVLKKRERKINSRNSTCIYTVIKLHNVNGVKKFKHTLAKAENVHNCQDQRIGQLMKQTQILRPRPGQYVFTLSKIRPKPSQGGGDLHMHH